MDDDQTWLGWRSINANMGALLRARCIIESRDWCICDFLNHCDTTRVWLDGNTLFLYVHHLRNIHVLSATYLRVKLSFFMGISFLFFCISNLVGYILHLQVFVLFSTFGKKMHYKVTKMKALLGSVVLQSILSFNCLAEMNTAFIDENTQEKWILETILKPNGIDKLDDPKIKYRTGSADLNNDGKIETFVFMFGSYFCGSGGCSGYLFNDQGAVISEFMVMRPPVLVASSKNKGWQDIVVWSNGGLRRLQYDGAIYPLNASLAPKIEIETLKQAAIKKVQASQEYQQGGYELNYVVSEDILTPFSVIHLTFKQKDQPNFLYHANVDLEKDTLEIEKKEK